MPPFLLEGFRKYESLFGSNLSSELKYHVQFSGDIVKLQKAAISIVMPVCLFIWMEQLSPYLTEFYEIWYSSIFQKLTKKIQVSVKSEKNDGHYTWKPIYIFDHISLIFS